MRPPGRNPAPFSAACSSQQEFEEEKEMQEFEEEQGEQEFEEEQEFEDKLEERETEDKQEEQKFDFKLVALCASEIKMPALAARSNQN